MNEKGKEGQRKREGRGEEKRGMRGEAGEEREREREREYGGITRGYISHDCQIRTKGKEEMLCDREDVLTAGWAGIYKGSSGRLVN